MTTSQRRKISRQAAANERRVAQELGTTRLARRGSYQSEPDVGIVLARGVPLQPEAKLRASLGPLRSWLQQAAGYDKSAAPLVVARERGGQSVAILPLATFLQIADITPTKLPTKHKPTRRSPRQLSFDFE